MTYVLAFWDGRKINLNLGHGQDIGGSGHVNQEICLLSVCLRYITVANCSIRPVPTASGVHTPIPIKRAQFHHIFGGWNCVLTNLGQ